MENDDRLDRLLSNYEKLNEENKDTLVSTSEKLKEVISVVNKVSYGTLNNVEGVIK